MLRIKKISLIYLPILLVLFCLFSEGAHAQQAPPKKNVMVLHGVWRIRTWEIPFNSTLHNEFLTDETVTAGITHVYLGLEDFPDGVYPQKLMEALRDRKEKNPVDLVISVLPTANRFLLSYGQELFPGVPKVFAIPGTREIQTLKRLKHAVIIPSVAEKALQTTVERIFSLLPDTRHLVVVCGDSPVDHNYLEMAQRAIASSKRVTKVSYLVGVPLDELWKRVSSLATDTAILFATYDKDKNGKIEESMDVAIRLSIRANAPVFSFNESLLGKGIVGGNVTNAESYAKDTAEAALILLKGEQPTAISPNEYHPFDVYDWRALKRWNISEDHLPPGSQVRYKTVTVWEAYKVHIIVGIGVICLETMLIYAMFISLMRLKRIKEALQESEERYRTLQENVPVGVYRTSNSGKFISVNPAAFNMFGLDAEEDLSSYQVSVFYNEPEKRRDLLSQLKTEGKITDFEAEFRRKDGSLFWGSLSATQVTDKDGNFIFIDGVVQDITERKASEAESQRLQAELAHVDRLVTMDTLATAIIHEINQPLAANRSYAQAALRFLDADQPDIDTVRKALQGVIEDNKRATTVINRLRALVKKEQPHRKAFDLNTIARETLSILSSEMVLRNAWATKDLSSEIPILNGDSVQIQQVVLNLLTNALDAIDKQPAGGRNIHISTKPEGAGWVKLSVSDSGSGIDPDKLEAVFVAFYTTKPLGLGLGLAICWSIVEAHGGELKGENRPDGGATFSFTLPIHSK